MCMGWGKGERGVRRGKEIRKGERGVRRRKETRKGEREAV